MDTGPLRRAMTMVLLGLWAVLGIGCATPSLHGIHTADRAVDDPMLEGIWSDDSGDIVLKIDRVGFGQYTIRATMSDDDTTLARVLLLDAHLVELGGARFADVVLTEAERKKLFRNNQALAVRTHQLLKLERKGTQLRLLQLDETELNKRFTAGTLTLDHAALDHASEGPELLLTAPTPQLQTFLADNAKDTALFDEISVVHRLDRGRP